MREHVDLPTLDALMAEWREKPPVHHLVAAYLSYKPPAPPAQAEADIAQWVGSLPTIAAPSPDASAWDAFVANQEPRRG